MDDQDQNNIEHNQSDLELELEATKAEAQNNMNGWMRAQADFQNYQKREESKRGEIVEFAREVAVVKLLPSLDALDQALRHIPIDVSKMEEWKNGISGTVKELNKALSELGVKKIEALGKKFDPHLHEAVRETPGEEDGIVVEEYQTGYEINGKIIRPSQVVISKKN